MAKNNLQLSGNQDKFLKIRNVLNIIFMAGAIVGILLYFYTDYHSCCNGVQDD